MPPKLCWEYAGRVVDAAVRDPNEDTVAAASIAVAEARRSRPQIAILATNKLFELAGTRSTLGKYNLDRHWRNARTHTLHDPVAGNTTPSATTTSTVSTPAARLDLSRGQDQRRCRFRQSE